MVDTLELVIEDDITIYPKRETIAMVDVCLQKSYLSFNIANSIPLHACLAHAPFFSTHYNNRSLRMTHTKINGPGLIIRYLLKPEPQWTKCFIQIVNCFAPKYNGMRFVSTTHNVETLIKLGLII